MAEQFNLQKFIISVVIIGVVLVIGIYITNEIGDTTLLTSTAGYVTNETGGFVNETGYTLADGLTATDFSNPVITEMWNLTNGETITIAGNVTVTNAGVVTNASVLNWQENVTFTYSYLYTATSSASNASDDVVDALATGTSWISILVIVGFATIILTMLTTGLGQASRREDAVPYY